MFKIYILISFLVCVHPYHISAWLDDNTANSSAPEPSTGINELTESIINGSGVQDACGGMCGGSTRCVMSSNGVAQCVCDLDPCRGMCGPNTKCTVSSKGPQCIGSSLGPECTDDTHCTNNRVCKHNKCEVKASCEGKCRGNHTQCRFKDNVAVCSCEEGYIGHPVEGCHGCSNDTQCGENHVCKHHKCEVRATCAEKCSRIHTQCSIEDNVAVCSCEEGYIGHPVDGCHGCSNDTECGENHVCKHNKCEVKASCEGNCRGNHTQCSIEDNVAVCRCEEGYIGHPDKPEGCYGCSNDTECGENHVCKHHKCEVKASCAGKCRGNHTQCSIEDNVAVCSCEEGYIGHPDKPEGCQGCSNDTQCGENHVCKHHKCEVKASCEGKCRGTHTQCSIEDNVAVCSCEEGYIGHPDKPEGCRPECLKDYECSEDKYCQDQRCVKRPSPEELCAEACGYANRDCKVHSHVAFCGCKPGYVGNPYDKNWGCYYATEKASPAKCWSEDRDRPSQECVRYFNSKPEKVFTIMEEKANWFDALRLCEVEDKMLAIIDNRLEQVALEKLMIDKGFDQTKLWLAATDLKNPGKFQWVHGHTFNRIGYSSWLRDKPWGLHQHCVAITERFSWASEECDKTYAFVCQNKY